MRNSYRQARTGLIFLALLATIVAILSAEPTSAPPRVTISDLLADKNRWDSKLVEVVGFHKTLPEMSAIYETEKEADLPHRNASRGLWVDYSGSPPEVKLVKAGFVRIVGRFEFHPGRGCGHMNRWPAELRKLEQMEIMQPPKSKGAAPTTSPRGTNSQHVDKK